MAYKEVDYVRLRLSVDLSAISDARARKLLKRYGGLATALASAYRPGDDDLVAIAQIAVLEAAVLYQKEAGASLDTWIRRLVRWRIKEALPRYCDEDELDEDGFVANGKTDYERVLASLERDEWVRQQVETLEDDRHRHIVLMVLQGDSYRQIAVSLGLSPATVMRKAREAMRLLLAAAVLDDVLE